MDLLIQPGGNVRCVYGESIDLTRLGRIMIRRGSHVEPTADCFWSVDLSPVDGPRLGPFRYRSDALKAEIDWLHEHWLCPDSAPRADC